MSYKMKKALCMLAGAALAIAIYWLGFVNGENYALTEVLNMIP